MKMTSKEELELQKNRLEILKMSGKEEMIHQAEEPSSNLYAWEYELEYYKRLRKRERFYAFGAWCGIVSLILVLLLNGTTLVNLVSNLLP